jgi:hypothetical protein
VDSSGTCLSTQQGRTSGEGENADFYPYKYQFFHESLVSYIHLSFGEYCHGSILLGMAAFRSFAHLRGLDGMCRTGNFKKRPGHYKGCPEYRKVASVPTCLFLPLPCPVMYFELVTVMLCYVKF